MQSTSLDELGGLLSAKKNVAKKSGGFQSMAISRNLLKCVLKQGFNVPTPIQRKAIPSMLQGGDVVAMARTGSGKTLAYLIPTIEQLKEHSNIVGIRALILSPTRELTLQIVKHCKKILGNWSTLRISGIVGGDSIERHFTELVTNPDILVASPGRLLHLMQEASLKLSMIKIIILDEADRLFELGMQPQIAAILQKCPDNCQRAMFSATMPTVLSEFASAGLHSPTIIRLDAEMNLSDKLKHSTFVVRTGEKLGALHHTLSFIRSKQGEHAQSLVFVESKYHVDFIELLLRHLGYTVNGIHGQMDQEARRIAVSAFTKKKTQVMVVTDVAARGIDIPLLDNVINFSFPYTPKLFIHRVGRVARAGRSGCAFSIVTTDDFAYYLDLMQFLQLPLQCQTPKDQGAFFFADDGCYGRLPERSLQIDVAAVAKLCDDDIDLYNHNIVCGRSHGKYERTKKKPSPAASREAKGDVYRYENIPVHPMLYAHLSEKQIEADAAIQHLRTFKAKDSFLDLVHNEKVFQMKKKPPAPVPQQTGNQIQQAPTAPKSLAERLMESAKDRKTASSASFLSKIDSNAGFRGFRDPQFYMAEEKSHETIQDSHLAIRDAALDIAGETARDQVTLRNVYSWSKHKNKYVKMNIGEAKSLLKGVKNEAGKLIDFKKNTGFYNRWTQKTNLRVQDVGEVEDSVAGTTLAQLKSRKRGRIVAENEEEKQLQDNLENNPNAGRKIKVGRKIKKLPAQGRIKGFQELVNERNGKQREKAKLAKRQERKKSGKQAH